jgi:hypothetical protein
MQAVNSIVTSGSYSRLPLPPTSVFFTDVKLSFVRVKNTNAGGQEEMITVLRKQIVWYLYSYNLNQATL